MSRKIAIINVGANTASGALKSPIFKDGTFEFVPVEIGGLFCWDKIPENDNENENLKNSLKHYFSIDWVKAGKIEKIDEGRTIRISTEKNSLSLTLNVEKTKMNLEIDDVRTDGFPAKMKNGKLKIYRTDDAVEETFSKFKSFTGRPITDFIPAKFFSELMHNDPEFVTHTYGDLPEYEGRSRNLQKFNEGDTLYYLARLVEWNNGNWRKPGFFLVGKLVYDRVVKKSELENDPTLIRTVQNNAHVKRWLIEPKTEPKNFWVLVGSDQSKRFIHAVPFDKNIIQKVLLRSDGTPIKWEQGKSELRTIGENTRTCRIIDDPARIKILEEHVREFW